MKSYIEIQVPLRYDAQWLNELRNELSHVKVRWQMGYYHITTAFLDETPLNVNLCPIFEKHLNGLNALTLTFDKLDVFTTLSGTHIIYLTASDIPQSFLSVNNAIRSELMTAGCQINSPFCLHVTLGRVIGTEIHLNTLQKLVRAVSIPDITLTLNDVDYRLFRGKFIYETKLKG